MAAQCCHCRHTEDDTPVLPAKLPVVPAKPTKPELAILFGHLNRSKNSIKFREALNKIRKLPIILFGIFEQYNMVSKIGKDLNQFEVLKFGNNLEAMPFGS